MIAEAERRGYKAGVTIKLPSQGVTKKLGNFKAYENNSMVLTKDGNENVNNYLSYWDEFAESGNSIYNDTYGWSEIVKDDTIKIGEHKVEVEDQATKIGCKTVCNDVLIALQSIAEYCDENDCSIDVSNCGTIQYDDDDNDVDFSLATLNKIIKKIK